MLGFIIGLIFAFWLGYRAGFKQGMASAPQPQGTPLLNLTFSLEHTKVRRRQLFRATMFYHGDRLADGEGENSAEAMEDALRNAFGSGGSSSES